ncbi:MAG: hypothetical protein WC358_03730 [Ignavibacteria bacterium]|jgi:hypothetical protein
MRKKVFINIIILFALVSFSCTGIKDAIVNVQRLQFKLGSISNMKIAGLSVGNKASIKDFNLLDGATLLSAFTNGKLNTSFTLNLLAKNPNDGTGGTANTSAVIKSLAWRLFIDDSELINGNIANGIEVPGVGKETTIPIEMAFDLLSFFKNDNYEKLINLGLALGGKNGSSARVKLGVVPTVDTFLGPITYPGEITVIDKEFKSK